jgi:hypothetical protein
MEHLPVIPAVRLADLGLAGTSPAAIRRAVRSGSLVRVHRGVYRTEGSHPFPDLLAAALHLGPEATACVSSAVLLHGVAGIVGASAPEFALPPGLERTQRTGVRLHFWAIDASDVVEIAGIPSTGIAATLADVARLLPRLQAVSCLDSALHLGLITLDEVLDLASRMTRRPQAVAGRRRLLEARVGAQSPLETRVRLRATDGDCPPDALQVPIYDRSGTIIGYGDIGYRLPEDRWLIVEADGRSVHEAPEALLHDRHRQNAMVGDADALMIRFAWQDTLHPGTIPGVLRPILRRLGWRPRRP